MEQYLIKNFGLFGTEHILNKIKEKFEQAPSNDLSLKILNIFSDLLSKEEYQHLTDSEYTDIVETAYKMNPQFFMTYVYPQIESIIHPSIEPIKKDLIELIENLNNETI